MLISTPVDQVLHSLDLLSNEDQEIVLNILKQRHLERRHAEIIAEAKETSAANLRGELKTQSVADFIREVNAEHST